MREKVVRVGELQRAIGEFARQRDWDQFHTPKNLSMALAVEAAELMELFQWGQSEAGQEIRDPNLREAIGDELADILIYLVRMADLLHIDLDRAAFNKIQKNARKYPAEKARGSAKKYTEL